MTTMYLSKDPALTVWLGESKSAKVTINVKQIDTDIPLSNPRVATILRSQERCFHFAVAMQTIRDCAGGNDDAVCIPKHFMLVLEIILLLFAI